MKKKIALIISIVLCVSVLGGCLKSGNEKAHLSDRISVNAVNFHLAEDYNGALILNEDGTFTPLSTDIEVLDESIDDMESKYLWSLSDDAVDIRQIPRVNKESDLIAVYNSEKTLPEACVLEKYGIVNYTIGCHVYKDNDGCMYISTDDGVQGSDALETLRNAEGDGTYRIATYCGDSDLPVKDVDDNLHILSGMELGPYFEFQYYAGEEIRTMLVQADARIFQRDDIVTIENAYTNIEEGYYFISLPENLVPGYYYLPRYGMFEYVA